LWTRLLALKPVLGFLSQGLIGEAARENLVA
jgi:hypothetical protein